MEATNSTTVWDATKSDSTVLVNLKGGHQSGGQVTVVGPNAQQSLQYASDSVLVPFLDSHSLGDVGAPTQAIGNKKASVEHNLGHDLPADNKGFSQQSGSSPFGRSSGSRPSSSYSNRSQQSCGSQKGMPNKEWKPKSTSITASEATEKVIIVDDVPLAADTIPHSAPMSNSVTKDELLKVDKSFNDLQLSDKQHVIIPDHLQVSESEKHGLSFGSFNASFQKTMVSTDPEGAKRSFLPVSSQLNCIDDEPHFRQGDQNSSSILQEEAESVPHQLPSAKLEECSTSAVQNSSVIPTESDQCRDDSATSGVPPPYSTFELAPHSHGNEIMVTEESKSQACMRLLSLDMLHACGLMVNNLPVRASSVSASVANPAAGVIHTSIAIPQQSVPVFRQSVGVHLPQFPVANYVPYNQYISPFLFPSPTLHPFLGNATFPQPPSTGAMYPAPGSAGVPPPVKYPLPSFKPGANTGSQASIGVPGAYGTYGSITSIYSSSTTVPSGNPAENDDIASGQFKENSIYIAGPQTEGSTLWVPAAGRDISSLQANSFYGYPPQGQQVTFAPQAGHAPFGGFYHQAHTVTGAAVHPLLQPSHTMAGALEIVGTPGGVYQQPQVQMSWGNY
ncbi:hypothetical protein EJB05_49865 [Eragrostis curvula]|uniref:GBF-interacting protein 1 N-terminal domain-containing protein n=1 Tax=Eragrostis curvula TaxID=38414 RepID=A0A5J9T7V8_9POAL|nr:hypothetical protein EJB05_49865 [Eragrostis curvula]